MRYMIAVITLLSGLRKVLRGSIDEMWSYVGRRKNKVWIITFVLHITERIRMAFSVVRRSRDRESLREIIRYLPAAEEYHTDGWKAYDGLFEGKGKHVKHLKSKGYVNLNEGIHNMLRIYNARLKRRGHSYSKSLFWHVIELFALWWRKGWLITCNSNYPALKLTCA